MVTKVCAIAECRELRFLGSKVIGMHLGQLHYLPLSPGFFSILVALFVIVLILIQLVNLATPREINDLQTMN
jgi:hypothetical protein